ncbi:hypothetical protein ACJX0J_012368, partial [Zea mays]
GGGGGGATVGLAIFGVDDNKNRNRKVVDGPIFISSEMGGNKRTTLETMEAIHVSQTVGNDKSWIWITTKIEKVHIRSHTTPYPQIFAQKSELIQLVLGDVMADA